MPGVILATHEALLERPLLEVADEVAVVPPPPLLLRTAIASSCPAWRALNPRHAFARWWVVCWARLKPDGLTGVEVASNALDGSRNPALLLVHCRSPLAPGAHVVLRVKTALVDVGLLAVRSCRHLLRRLRQDHLLLPITTRLRAIGRRLWGVISARRVHDVTAIHGLRCRDVSGLLVLRVH